MTKYVAKCYIGFTGCYPVSYGETLDESQVEALGEERVMELVKRGELGVIHTPDPGSAAPEAPAPEDKPAEEAAAEQPEEADVDEEEAPDEAILDDLVSDGYAPEKPARKTRGKAE